jgi:TonB family protein
MNTEFSPISFSTAFSLLLHAVFAVAIVQTQDVMQATGKGIEIELVSSSYISQQLETEQAANKAASVSQQQQQQPAAQRETHNKNSPAENIEARQEDTTGQLAKVPATVSNSIDNDSGEKAVTRSTDTARNYSTIIELLHSKISEHKQYPYMARRQRREGVARVEFVLYPDGSIDNAHLVDSSRTRSLDNAAIKAVESIEPFSVAGEYLQQPEAFQVDVVFNVL